MSESGDFSAIVGLPLRVMWEESCSVIQHEWQGVEVFMSVSIVTPPPTSRRLSIGYWSELTKSTEIRPGRHGPVRMHA